MSEFHAHPGFKGETMQKERKSDVVLSCIGIVLFVFLYIYHGLFV